MPAQIGEFVAGDDGELTLEQLEVTTPFVLGHVNAKFERQPARLQELHEATEKLPTKAGEHDPPVLQQLQRQQSPLVHVDGLAVPEPEDDVAEDEVAEDDVAEDEVAAQSQLELFVQGRPGTVARQELREISNVQPPSAYQQLGPAPFVQAPHCWHVSVPQFPALPEQLVKVIDEEDSKLHEKKVFVQVNLTAGHMPVPTL